MHIQAGKLYARGNMLLRKFHLISDEANILLFKSFCSNVYCCSLWCLYNASFLDKVRVAYNNSFRLLLKLPKFCSASNMLVSSPGRDSRDSHSSHLAEATQKALGTNAL